jgi:hypothetical protein
MPAWFASRQPSWKGEGIVPRVHREPADQYTPRRVFVSHASDQSAFVAAARSAVVRAGDALIDMDFFTAQRTDPADYCARMVAAADVYAGIIGPAFGSPVRGRPNISYTELEFETATARGLPRLVFLLAEDAREPASGRSEEAAARQSAFRGRLRDAGLTTASVGSPIELELCLYQALVELAADGATGSPPRAMALFRRGRAGGSRTGWRPRCRSSS